MTGYTRWIVVGMATVALIVSIGNVMFVNRLVCTIVRANVAVYVETPPTTPAGVNARDSWQSLHRRLHC